MEVIYSKNRRLHPVNIFVRCEHNLCFLWDHFEHIGDSQFMELITTSNSGGSSAGQNKL